MTMQQQVLPGRNYLKPVDTLWLQVMARLRPGGTAGMTRPPRPHCGVSSPQTMNQSLRASDIPTRQSPAGVYQQGIGSPPNFGPGQRDVGPCHEVLVIRAGGHR